MPGHPRGEADQAVRARGQRRCRTRSGWSPSSTARRRSRPPARPAARTGTAPRARAGGAARRRGRRPGTRRTTAASGSGSRDGRSPIDDPSAAATAGTTSPRERWWYAGSTKPSATLTPSGSGRTATRRTTAARRPRRRRRRPRRPAARSRRRRARRCSRGRRRTAGSEQPAGSRSIRLTPPQPIVMTASAGGCGPEVGLAIIRVTTTERHRRQADRLGRGGGVGLRQQVVAGVLVGVRQDQPARREHDHGQVAAYLVALERRLVVDVERDHLLPRDRRLDTVRDHLGVVAGAVDRLPKFEGAVGVIGGACAHVGSLSRDVR